MNELDTIKKIYFASQRPVMLLGLAGEFLWCNPQGMAVNLMSHIGTIASHIGTSDKFLLSSPIFSGECELRRCEGIGKGIYIAEVFDIANNNKSHYDSEYLNLVIRNGVSMITSTLQLIYDEFGSQLSENGIKYLNNGMLGCYDMLRGVAICRDSNRAEVKSGGDDIVDFSCLTEDFCQELAAFSSKLPISFNSKIEPGIFVSCDYDLLYNAVVWLVMEFCRKYVICDLTLKLRKDGENAVFSIDVNDNETVFDESIIRRHEEICHTNSDINRCVDNLVDAIGGKKYEDNGFSVPMCAITSIPLKSPKVRYKADRFSKSRVILSGIYRIDYFDSCDGK